MTYVNRVMTTSALAALVGLAACSQSVQRASYPPSNTLRPVETQAALTPTAPAAPATTPDVASSDLPDEGTTETAAVETAPAPVASVANKPAKPVSREAMIGRWSVNADGKNCEIFLALTKWSGGYRAATRGCGGSDIGSVQAWDVKGNRIVLVDASGGQAASLTKTGDTRYAGATGGGGSITFTR